ncbi:MAG: EF-hand domain-containing protein [Vicinamibacterales bacterium]
MVSSITQSFSYSALQLNVSVQVQPYAVGTAATAAPVDTVTLTPPASEETAAAAGEAEAGSPAGAPAAPAQSRAERRAEALFNALDADGDGAVTGQEFTDGALQLLRNAGARRRIHEGDDEGRHEGHGTRRLERRLEKLFDRVDANDDGAIDKNELTEALSRAGARRSAAARPEAADGAAGANGGTFVAVSVTYVSIAVQRYAAVQDAVPLSEASRAPSGARALVSDSGGADAAPAA